MRTDGLPGYADHFQAPEGYLDYARYGPPSTDVLTATAGALERSARASHDTVNELMRAEQSAREAAARLAGVSADHTVLLPNASTGLFHAAFGIPAGTVLVPATDFPANHYPWRRTAALGRAVPRWLAPVRPAGSPPTWSAPPSPTTWWRSRSARWTSGPATAPTSPRCAR